jgi:hypothetical protein
MMDNEDSRSEGKYELGDGTQLEFLGPKTIVVIDKEKFLFCKHLMMNKAEGKTRHNNKDI